MGLYVFVNSLLVGFFGFAALHYFWHWWLSRREPVLLAFTIHCLFLAIFCVWIVVLAAAGTIEECQTALDMRTTFGLLWHMTAVWVLMQLTGMRAHWYVQFVCLICTTFCMINLCWFPVAGVVRGIDWLQLPWDEVIVIPVRSQPPVWTQGPIWVLVVSVELVGLVGAARLWSRDRVGAALIAVGAAGMLANHVVSLLIDYGHFRLPFVGALPQAVFVVVIGLQLSREYARRGAELSENERRFRTLIEHASDGIFITDASGRYVDANTAARQMLGYTREEMADLSIINVVAADETARVVPELARLHSGDSIKTEWRVRRKDGTEFHGEVSACLLPDARVLAFLRDISERKAAEQALHRSEERHRLIVKTQTEFIVQWLPDGTRTFVNESYCRYFGVRAEECVGTSFFPLIAPEFRAMIHEKIASITPATPEATDEHLSYVAGGGMRWQQWTDVGAFDAAGNLIELLSTGRDITERKQAEQKLQLFHERLKALSQQILHAQESERRRLARELHDQIGQLLTAINLRMHQLKTRCGSEFHTVLDGDIKLVNRTIDQVREMSLNLRPPMLDVLGLEAALRWYVDNQRRSTGMDLHLTSVMEGTGRCPDVEIACFRVAQEALTNIVRHAQAHRVCIDLRQDETELQLTIQDDGVGFDVAAAQARAGRGRSFGVLAMQERVELLGGRFTIDSAAERGTRIVAQFPFPAAADVSEPNP